MLPRLLLAITLLGITAAPSAHAQTSVIVSPKPDRIALTVYRAPEVRGEINLRYLQGFAMITETRRIRLPRGRAVIRFEGVAEGIIPVSAIVDGLPGGTIEKNRDLRLLSPASLVDGTLGRQVTLTRTDKATGRHVSEDATIVAGPAPGVILRTASGIEALGCSGLPERLEFAGVPLDLASKPVLSVTTSSPVSRTVNVQLTYLSWGFDWRASYVATLAPDGKELDLFAWLTLANSNAESFPDAQIQAVAGQPNRQTVTGMRTGAAELRLVCYPLGTTTSDLWETRFKLADPIVLTGSRMPPMRAVMLSPPTPSPPLPPEDLGDLKLYRVPMTTTVSANGQKQVALLAQSSVPFERRYRREVYPGQGQERAPTSIVLMLTNEDWAGLGIALPAGSTALYAARGSDKLLLGLGTVTDRTVGERVRLAAGQSHQVLVTQTNIGTNEALLTVSNANQFSVTLDIPIGAAGQTIETEEEDVGRFDGIMTWSPTLPPGGRTQLSYRY